MPSGASAPPPCEAGTFRRERRQPRGRTPPEWASVESAPAATEDPSEVGG
jgi:hypothetical protein